MQKVGRPGTWQTGSRITLIASTEYVTILFGVEVGGIGAYGRALWDLQYGEIVDIFSSWISTYWDIAWEIGDQTGSQ